MRGILSHGAYLPHRRLDRATIAPTAGTGGGKGIRTVAGFDEDSTTMAVEAGRRALRPIEGDHALRPGQLLFSTVTPAYLDKTNATAVHAALGLGADVAAIDVGGAMRSTVGALRLALDSTTTSLVVAADIRTGLPGSADEAAGGDAAAALVIGDGTDETVLAELIGRGSATAEFLDRWRTPGEVRSKQWEERFGELRYVPLGQAAWADALADAGLADGATAEVDRVAVASTHARAARGLIKALGLPPEKVVDDLSATVGMTGAAQPALLLSSLLEQATPGDVVALVVLADGADVFLFRTTAAVATFVPAVPLAGQISTGAAIDYGTFLRWRGMLTAEPPRRPEPARVSAPAAARSEDWKFGLVGGRANGDVHLPAHATDDERIAMADARGTIATFTVDKLAWSPSPPVVFAVVDFDGGGRLPVELTDVGPPNLEDGTVAIGARVEMTFRRLSSADGIHNYFWKARPVAAPEVSPDDDQPVDRRTGSSAVM